LKSKKQKLFRKINRDLKHLAKDLAAIVAENNLYQNQVSHDWMESLPIETLSESIAVEHAQPRARMSLCDFKIKNKLHKSYNQKIDEFDILRHKKSEAEIDCILENIEQCLKIVNE
jgi:hypothetical protein